VLKNGCVNGCKNHFITYPTSSPVYTIDLMLLKSKNPLEGSNLLSVLELAA
jgi:hypothetical protein